MTESTKRKRVVIATTTGFHVRRLARALQDRPIDLRYFSYMPRFRLRQDGLADASSTSLFLSLLPLSALALARPFSSLRSWATEALFAPTDRAIARRLPPCDVFIGLSSLSVLAAQQAKQLYGATVILERGSRHVLSQNDLVVAGGGTPLSSDRIRRELDGYACADYVSLLSEHSRESFIERGFPPDRLFVNPLGVDLSCFRPSPRPDGSVRILFVGAWSQQKGADLLLSAMERRPSWQLTHVGTIGDADQRHLSNVNYIGTRDHRQLSEIMRDHHVLVLPSRQDGFGMVLLEGLASGLPVVASRMTGGRDIRERLTDPSLVELCDAGDCDSLLAAMEAQVDRLDTRPADRQIMTPADRAQFGWSAYADRYWSFLQNVLDTRTTA